MTRISTDVDKPFDDLLKKAKNKLAKGIDPEIVIEEFLDSGLKRVLHPIIKEIKQQNKTDHSSDG